MHIDDESVQLFLKRSGFYQDKIDGDFGKNSMKAARGLLSGMPPEKTTYKAEWSDQRTRIAVEQALLQSIGQDVGIADGLDGPRTQIALERWQDHVTFKEGAEPQSGKPVSSGQAPKWPRHDDALAFYGKPGTGHTQIEPPYPIFYAGVRCKKIGIHSKCAESALRIMNAVKSHYGEAEIHRLGLDVYGGCYNNRVMRNGTRLSTHAFAAAWDWDPARNPLRATRATAYMAKPDYAYFIDAHEAEGWVSLGRSRNFDWMHFQAVRL